MSVRRQWVRKWEKGVSGADSFALNSGGRQPAGGSVGLQWGWRAQASWDLGQGCTFLQDRTPLLGHLGV